MMFFYGAGVMWLVLGVVNYLTVQRAYKRGRSHGETAALRQVSGW